MRAEDAAVDVRLVDHHDREVGEEVGPRGVVREDPEVEHVGIGEDDVGVAADRRSAAPSACRRRRSPAARSTPSALSALGGPGRAPWSGRGGARARAWRARTSGSAAGSTATRRRGAGGDDRRAAQAAWIAGLVTTAARSAAAQRAATSACSSPGIGASLPGRALTALCVTSRSSVRPASREQLVPGLDVSHDDHVM